MKIFFDVDLTLINTDEGKWTLRPGAIEVLTRFKDQNHEVYLWSASGFEHCQRFAKTYGCENLITDYFDKEPGVAVKPDCVVDDDEYLVEKWHGVHVQPFRDPGNTDDKELYDAGDHIESFLQDLQK